MKLLASLLALSLLAQSPLFAEELSFYIGTYTRPGGSEGIYRGVLDTDTGSARITGLAGVAKNPSFLAISPGGKFLYAAIEDAGGMVGAFVINADGTLKALNSESSKGSGNCHVSVDDSGRNVFAANYGSGTIACLPIKADGSLAPASASIQHEITSPDGLRKKAPHAHAICQNGAFVYACDLGANQVFIYKFDASKGVLTPNDPKSARLPEGSGPRHLAFRPQGGFAFVNNETTCEITSFAHDAAKGTLTAVHTLSTLPVDYTLTGKDSTAEIQCHPNGRFVYVSNRGHDSIAVFSIATDGKLTRVQVADAHAKIPRGFALSPDGKWLIAAGQSSDTLALHQLDPATGLLTFKNIIGKVGAPVNVEFLKP